MTVDVFIVGGGKARLELDASDLHDVAEQLRRERSLVGRLISMDGDEAVVGRVLVPCQRVVLIAEL